LTLSALASTVDAQWIRGQQDEWAVEAGCWFDEEAAEHVREFFREFLTLVDGPMAGQPFELLPWQWEEIVAPLFGWKRENGRRRYRHAYIEVPKKNGKSPLIAGLELYLVVADGEPSARVYTAAADKEQAGIIHEYAARMAKESAGLREHFIFVDSQKRIVFPEGNAYIKALSADVPTKEGLNAHAVLVDELHAHAKPDLWNTLSYSTAARLQPLIISITTAGTDRESICWREREYALRVQSGDVKDLTHLTVIYGADAEKDDWTDPAVWERVNPSWGVVIQADEMHTACEKAKLSLSEQAKFKRYRLNIWTRTFSQWLDPDDWASCGEFMPLDQLAGRKCWGSLDLSSKIDFSSYVLCFPLDDGRFLLLPQFWIPRNNLERRQRSDRDSIIAWGTDKATGLNFTPGNEINYTAIRAEVNRSCKAYNMQAVGYDPEPHGGVTYLAQLLESEDNVPMLGFPQGIKHMSDPTKEFEAAVLGRKFMHGGNPVLSWMASNVVAYHDANENVKLHKGKSADRIDGIVASVMAYGLAMEEYGETTDSVYESRGLLSV